MPVNYDVGFFGNTPDDTHCAQATIRMVRHYFEPDRELSWEELDRGTGKVGNYTTWRMTGLLWMINEGYDVHIIETLDYQAFAELGAAYLAEFYGPAVAQWHVETSDILLERARAKEFALAANISRREPTARDIETYLDMGFLVQITVNARQLNGEPGYLGHAVLITGYNASGVILHDPGLPPRPGRTVSWARLESAWADPNRQVKHLAAFRHN